MPVSKIGDHILKEHSNFYVKDLVTEVPASSFTNNEDTTGSTLNQTTQRTLTKTTDSSVNRTTDGTLNKTPASRMSPKECYDSNPGYSKIFTSTPNVEKTKVVIVYNTTPVVGKPVVEVNKTPTDVNKSIVLNKPRSSLSSSGKNLCPVSDACVRCSAPGIFFIKYFF
jgi:hypothetical protein